MAFPWVPGSVSRGLGPLLLLVVPGILSSESGSVSHGLGPHPVFGGTLNSWLHLRGRCLLCVRRYPKYLRSPGSYFGVSLSGSFPAFGCTLHSVIDRLIFSISVSTVRFVHRSRILSPDDEEDEESEGKQSGDFGRYLLSTPPALFLLSSC